LARLQKSPKIVSINDNYSHGEIVLTDAFAAVQPESLVAGTDGTPVNFVANVLAGCLGAHPVRVLLDLALWHLSDPLTISAD